MEDFIETIWKEFGVESEEHCEQIEQFLLAAESGELDTSGIAGLFRSFHSLKGLAKALDLVAMESLAHRSEDLLGLVRDGSIAMTSDIAALLLQSLDQLKMLRGKAVETRQDGDKPEQLLAALEQAYQIHTHQESAPEEAIVTSTGGSTAFIALHEDMDMLSYFVELIKEQLPTIAALVDNGCLLNGPNAVDGPCPARDCDKAAEALETIEHASRVMAFDNICETVGKLREAIQAEPCLARSDHAAFLKLLAEFNDQIQVLENETGSEVGSDDIASALGLVLRSTIEQMLFQSSELLDMLEREISSGISDNDTLLAEQMQHLLMSISSHISFFVPRFPCDLLLFLADVFSRASRDELFIYQELIDVAREVLNSVVAMHKVISSGQSEAAAGIDREAYIRRIQDYVWVNDRASSDNPLQAVREFIKGLTISPELAEILTPENVRELMQLVKSGGALYEIMAHLEQSEELAMAFLNWVNDAGKVITNRSVFIGEANWYELLLVTTLAKEELESQLRNLDPGGDFLRLKATSRGIKPAPGAGSQDSAVPVVAKGGQSAAQAAANIIRVPGEMLDEFMKQIGEMVLARSQMNHAIYDEASREAFISLRQLARQGHDELLGLVEQMERQFKRIAESDSLIHSTLVRLQDGVMGLRVVPVETVFRRFPRVIRDLALAQGKKIRVEFTGQEVKIDKAMVEILADPLLHMVRNAVDHGIELPEERGAAGKPGEALVHLKAWQQGNNILVEISDDGRGISVEKVAAKAVERGLATEEQISSLSKNAIYDFLFLPGFSTAAAITETSGRGVGMDVVRTNVMKLGGSILIDSIPGSGSVFTLRLPLSAAVQEVLMVSESGQTLAIPGRYVSEIIEVVRENIQSVKGQRAMLLRGSFLPLVRLGRLLGFACDDDGENMVAVVVSNGKQSLGILVHRVMARQELYTKDIQAALASLPGVGGASILGDGRVVIILDGEALFTLAERCGSPGL